MMPRLASPLSLKGDGAMSLARRTFATRLRAMRIAKGFENAKDFAAEIGVEPGTYNRWERAETEPNLEKILRICQLLETDPNFLLLGRIRPTE